MWKKCISVGSVQWTNHQQIFDFHFIALWKTPIKYLSRCMRTKQKRNENRKTVNSYAKSVSQTQKALKKLVITSRVAKKWKIFNFSNSSKKRLFIQSKIKIVHNSKKKTSRKQYHNTLITQKVLLLCNYCASKALLRPKTMGWWKAKTIFMQMKTVFF